ncbi:hypothetical protein G6F37_011856 [Rhizopus arrhizus]|nr:hypothetical protein G6F38_011924 [Rhizopus arrhizus]KAG1147021.1 hypothetical protein G6F37_011856 [Rhizopus arrhizus]
MSVPESEFTALQQQVQQQQQILQQQQTAHQQPVPESEDAMEDTLHSLPVKMDHSWSPTPALSEFLSMDSNLFLTDLMPSKDHTEIIEQYPPQKNLSYVPPQAVSSAFEQMNAQQKAMDSLLKHQQYASSAVFRPLDVLAFELSKDSSNPNVDRFLTMMKHTRQLLLHSLASLTQSRKNVAFKSINRSFHAPEQEKKDEFIMAPEDFQLSLTKQHAVSKSLSEAHRFQKDKRLANQSSFSAGPPRSFFRQGPPSQHGGPQYNNTNNSFNQPNRQNHPHSSTNKQHQSRYNNHSGSHKTHPTTPRQ